MGEGSVLVIALFVFGGASLLFYVGFWIHRVIPITNRTLENERMVTLSERATVLSKRMDYDNVDLATWGYGGMEEGDTGVLH